MASLTAKDELSPPAKNFLFVTVYLSERYVSFSMDPFA